MMMKIGDLLTLELHYSDRVERYKCKLVERNGQQLYIDYPINMETKRTAFFLDGTQLKCSFIMQDGSVYLFESEVVGRVKQKIPMMMLTYPGDDQLIKIQRRQYVRVETAVDVAIHPTNSVFQPFVTVTDDISAGGAAIIVSKKQKLESGTLIDSWFVLPMQNGDFHYFKFEAKVVRNIPLDPNRYKTSLEFLNIEALERQVLLRFCFDRQLAMRRKGIRDE
ncbi:flagellar brake protein [Robertmurraya sp. Marseille-Q9965]